jgi:P-type Cu+ transporter
MIFGNKRHASETSGEAIYTCPMHPEVQSAEPGKCPKCGMFLVEKTDADSGEHKHEASGESSGCCGGHGHKQASTASSGGCCGGHKDEHAHS